MCDGSWNCVWGMHGFWWLFWLAVTVMFAILLMRATGRAQPPADTPLELLQRRYAAGEIDTQEYEQRKTALESDVKRNSSSFRSGTF